MQVIQSFGVPCELTIVSAHRTPDRMLEYARNAHKRGLKVIIAGAGGAAHLPGMVAALTPLPTVGVPVTPAGAHLDGLDALMSIVQVSDTHCTNSQHTIRKFVFAFMCCMHHSCTCNHCSINGNPRALCDL